MISRMVMGRDFYGSMTEECNGMVSHGDITTLMIQCCDAKKVAENESFNRRGNDTTGWRGIQRLIHSEGFKYFLFHWNIRCCMWLGRDETQEILFTLATMDT